jgi:hypothetical protein
MAGVGKKRVHEPLAVWCGFAADGFMALDQLARWLRWLGKDCGSVSRAASREGLP